MDECSKNILDCLVGSHGLTHVVGALSEIAANTSTVHMADGSRDSKREAKQWSKMSTRLMDLHDWCAEFGPGSDCR